jgi:hypothetical protein
MMSTIRCTTKPRPIAWVDHRPHCDCVPFAVVAVKVVVQANEPGLRPGHRTRRILFSHLHAHCGAPRLIKSSIQTAEIVAWLTLPADRRAGSLGSHRHSVLRDLCRCRNCGPTGREVEDGAFANECLAYGRQRKNLVRHVLQRRRHHAQSSCLAGGQHLVEHHS